MTGMSYPHPGGSTISLFSASVPASVGKIPCAAVADQRRRRPHRRTVEPSVVRQNLKKYAASPAVTEMKSFAGRNHFLIAAPD